MLKKFAADALGISEIGKVISPDDYDKVDADDYIFHEDDEKIFFLIKSRTDEYCFTNLAFIHLDGTSAVSKKRMLKRYEYYKFPITNVRIETAGTIDLDCELKFTIDSKEISIDIRKSDIEKVKDIYKALIKIKEIMEENEIYYNHSKLSLETAVKVLQSNRVESDIFEQFKGINEYSFEWLKSAKKEYIKKDFGDLFKKYINN